MPNAARLIDALGRRGMDFVGQEIVSQSTMPVWNEGRLSPHPFQIRVFAAATEDGWVVMPGGFCRASTAADARAISMQSGGVSADVWVLSDGPVATQSPVALRGRCGSKAPCWRAHGARGGQSLLAGALS
ncbi:MAG: circularly permuted type 2 ATP-grasp protein [Terricaulis sp.]